MLFNGHALPMICYTPVRVYKEKYGSSNNVNPKSILFQALEPKGNCHWPVLEVCLLYIGKPKQNLFEQQNISNMQSRVCDISPTAQESEDRSQPWSTNMQQSAKSKQQNNSVISKAKWT